MTRLSEDATTSSLRREAANAPMLDAEREISLIRAIQEREDGAAFTELIESHMRLVVAVAARFSRVGVPMAELVAEGTVGLVEAARRFELAKGTRFSTYAAWWVRARIRRFALGNRRIVGAPSTRNARRLLSGLRSAERTLTQATGERPSREALAEATGTTTDDIAMVESALCGRDVGLATGDEPGGVELKSALPDPESFVADEELRSARARRVQGALSVLDRREL